MQSIPRHPKRARVEEASRESRRLENAQDYKARKEAKNKQARGNV